MGSERIRGLVPPALLLMAGVAVAAWPTGAVRRDAAQPSAAPAVARRRLALPVHDDDLITGPPDSPITLTFFFAYSSERTTLAARRLADALRETGAVARIVWKHAPQPLPESARLPHVGAVAANREGVFPAFHERLLSEPTRGWDRQALLDLGRELGCDGTRWSAAMADQTLLDLVDRSDNLASVAGVGLDPALFLDGRPVDVSDAATLRASLASATVEVQGLRALGSTLDEIRRERARGGRPPGTKPDTTPRVDIPIREDDPSRGPADAPVTIIVFSDFRCPGCGLGARMLRTLEEEHPGAIRVVFKQFPIISPLAARATIAAQRAGKFWEVHDQLYFGPAAQEKTLDWPVVERVLGEVGMDPTALRREVESSDADAKIERDMTIGQQVGVTSTPTFVVNGRLVSGDGAPQACVDVALEELAGSLSP